MIGLKTKDTLRRDRSALERMLTEAGGVVKGKAIKCPFHDDAHASGSIHEDADGVWRFKCHAAGCGFSGDVYDVRARHSGKPVDDLLREAARNERAPTHTNRSAVKPARVFPSVVEIVRSVSAYRTVETHHQYVNPDSREAELVVLRIDDGAGGKDFLQYHPERGGFASGAPPKPWPIYNRSRLRGATVVVVVEGEKCVEALAAVGVVATTSPCGAGNAAHADWQPLAGKQVYLWPDADPISPQTGKRGGIEHMRDVAAILEKLNPAPQVFWFDPFVLELPPKGDVVDFMARLPADDDKADAVWRVLTETSEELGAAGEVAGLIEDAIAGRWASFELPWPNLGGLTRFLLPTTATIVCGDPGSTKSFLVLEGFCCLHESGVKVALYALEDQRRLHLLRVLAQLSGVADVTDDRWLKANGTLARDLCAKYRDRLESFGRCITSPGDTQPTPRQLAEWVERQCADGCQVIGIDPISDADFSERPWQDDREFMWRARSAIRRAGARLVLVTHPRKGGSSARGCSALDDVAGGAIYSRGSQTVLWVMRRDPAEAMKIHTPCGDCEVECDRIIKILKARNGKGAGASLGYIFDPGSLRFAEQGVIVKETKRPAVQA